jgi:hypothetical protein
MAGRRNVDVVAESYLADVDDHNTSFIPLE